MQGDDVGTFNLLLKVDNSVQIPVMSFTGTLGNEWTVQTLELGFFTTSRLEVNIFIQSKLIIE
jgi:hypothetical protein